VKPHRDSLRSYAGQDKVNPGSLILSGAIDSLIT